MSLNRYSGWAGRPDEHIRAALLLSLLLHLGMLAFWKLPPLILAMEGQKVLTVILLPPQPSSLPEAEMQAVPEPELADSVPPPLPAEHAKAPEHEPEPPVERREAPVPPASITHQPAAESELFQAAPANPIVETRDNQIALQAQALLVIGADGSVGQIIWKSLPAVTEEELRRMEQMLRSGAYQATGRKYPVTQTIDIPR